MESEIRRYVENTQRNSLQHDDEKAINHILAQLTDPEQFSKSQEIV